MTTRTASADTPLPLGTQGPARPPSAQAPPSWPRRRNALILAGTAKLITIPALKGTDRIAIGPVAAAGHSSRAAVCFQLSRDCPVRALTPACVVPRLPACRDRLLRNRRRRAAPARAEDGLG
jgi:hypothetical protein